MDCKFNIGDYVYYRGNKPSDIYLVVGRTEYSRKKTIYCGKDRLVHEPTYELINIFYTKDRIIKDIADIYGIPMFSNCREHHMTLKESRAEDIHTIPFKFNLNDYVTLKNGSVSYKITSRTEWLDGGNPTYELMRITESEHVYFEYYSEELINEKICVKEIVDNFNNISNNIKYQIIGEPTEDEKKAAANKIWDICKESPAMGNAVMDLIGSDAYQRVMMYKTKDILVKTNLDALVEKLRNMNSKDLAGFIVNCTALGECPNCPAFNYCDQHMHTTEDGWSRVPDENGEILDCNQIFERWLKEDTE